MSYYQGGWNVTHVEVPADGWIHVAWRNSATEMRLFLDGTLAYTGPPVAPGQATGFLHFGLRHNNSEGFEGFMDDAFLWDDADAPLTDEAIASIAAAGLAQFLGLAVDADGDGLPDGWETEHGLDPADDGSVDPDNGPEGDPDDDSLTNAQEFSLGTMPNAADTDNDGIDDGSELAGGTHPRKPDTDGDGLTDGDEIARGTLPTSPDTDGDGIGDGAEVALGSDPLDPASGPPSEAFLVLHLPFDGDVSDRSGQGNDGELLGEPVFSSDIPEALGSGQALFFPNDGAAEDIGVSVPANDSLASNSFTLAYWVKPTAPQGNAGLERLTSRAGDLFETALGDRNAVGGAGDPLTLSYFQGGWQNTEAALAQDEWTHVTWRNRGGGAEDLDLFLNGELAFTGPGAPPGRPGGGLMHIGTRHNRVEGFEGLLDDLRLYAAPLSNQDIAALAAGSGPAVFHITHITHTPGSNILELTWDSQPGQLFNIETSSDLQNSWSPALQDIPAAPAPALETSSSVERTGAPDAYYRVVRIQPPAPLSEDFENGAPGWITGIIGGGAGSGTSWELGAPVAGPGAAHSGAAAYGTGLTADYADATTIFLRSPVIDLTGAGRSRLTFWYYLEAGDGEGGRVNLLEADGSPLLTGLRVFDGADADTAAWTEASLSLGELNRAVILEFEFLSADDGNPGNNGAGWFIDDVEVR